MWSQTCGVPTAGLSLNEPSLPIILSTMHHTMYQVQSTLDSDSARQNLLCCVSWSHVGGQVRTYTCGSCHGRAPRSGRGVEIFYLSKSIQSKSLKGFFPLGMLLDKFRRVPLLQLLLSCRCTTENSNLCLCSEAAQHAALIMSWWRTNSPDG